MRILGFAGSLRAGSLNRSVLRAAVGLVPHNAEIEVFDLDGIPPFNQDLENALPPRVAEFKKKITEADALVIVTPEYNYSVTGVLKNAIDWASRPSKDNSWSGKPAAIMSASNGTVGGMRAQMHLRQILASLNVYVLPKPEVVVTFADQKIKDGVLVDEQVKEHIKKQIEALVDFAAKLKSR